MESQLTIRSAIDGLGSDLRAYLQAQYHVRDESVLRERRLLLEDGPTVAQVPYIESTPAYTSAKRYGDLELPENTKRVLTALSGIPESGIYPEPYGHQAEALTAFLVNRQDVMAATGTGSGKTEIFLLSILGLLVEEARLGASVTKLPACRALILYPMNALVADQLARLRKILGNPGVADLLEEECNRRVRFGMYTSRTPFPGEITSELNKSRSNDLYQKLYKPLLESPALMAQLKARGKWPAKDVARFFGREGTRWESRLKTSDDDVELLMRHEIQARCPDILITNYSMLEYMMLRPIERNIFDQTAKWLQNDGTALTIVLDEAHMYRGATGAEVAFLLRRLFARLGVKRDRVRFILTTASVGSGADDEVAAREFACDLTGLPRDKSTSIKFLRGSVERWDAARPATRDETIALADFDRTAFVASMHQPRQVARVLNSLGQRLGWPVLRDSTVAADLYSALSEFAPAKLLVSLISGNAQPVDVVATRVIAQETEIGPRDRAFDALLRLCNYAKRADNKVFLPARLHLFYRGLSGVYSCLNSRCAVRRDSSDGAILGRLYSEPRVSCDCGSRVFEVLTHRDCGALFLRGFVPDERRPTFLWHEPTTGVGDESTGLELSLTETQLLVAAEAPRFKGWQEVWLHRQTGLLQWQDPGDDGAWLAAYSPDDPSSGNSLPHRFGACPQCSKRTQSSLREPSTIMDLRTKGEQPFGVLVKRQLLTQEPDRDRPREKFPNQGRKVLLFSDGRQKAANLAKDIPDEVESDAFRELLAAGFAKLDARARERLPLTKTYAPFVAACADASVSPFFGADAQQLRNDIRTYREVCDSDVLEYLEECPTTTPQLFRRQLYRQAYGGLYSFRFIGVGWLTASRRFQEAIKRRLAEIEPDLVEQLTLSWIDELATDVAIDASFDSRLRAEVARYDKPNWAHKGTFPKRIADVVRGIGADPGHVERALQETLTTMDSTANGYFLKPDTLVLRFDLDQNWYRCEACFSDSPYQLAGRCARCGVNAVTEVNPNTDAYIASRKGYWRDPVRAAYLGESTSSLINAEEHTAQLSHKDSATGWIRTEEYELRFQDVLTDPAAKPPVDVLSCTTTMEVGVDIGSLTAVGLRNVPPQRENYQQRAGRAGRRGSAVSTVVTYCQGGAHDNHYFGHVADIASGAPRKLTVKVDNAKIAMRHVRSYLLQRFYSEKATVSSPDILSSLGTLESFFEEAGEASLTEFDRWTQQQVESGIGQDIEQWLGTKLGKIGNVAQWAEGIANGFVRELEDRIPDVQSMIARERELKDNDRTKLLEFLLDQAILPTYAFPTDLATFQVEEWDARARNLVTRYAPQQSTSRALSEYAPGRLITIDKRRYKSAAVVADVAPTYEFRAEPLFANPHRKPHVFCNQSHCSYVEDPGAGDASAREGTECPLCGVGALRVVEVITPNVFLPDDGREVSFLDDDADFSRATPAQFPVPVHHEGHRGELVRRLSDRLEVFRQADAELVVVNKGDPNDETGFAICDQCGRAALASVGAPRGPHNRPYRVLAQNRSGAYLRRCNGNYRQPVFLGHRFVTDLVILRMPITQPLCQMPRGLSADYCALQDALQTLAEALPLAAGKLFDLDFNEFSAGFRLIHQADATAPLAAEVYMFDTLSGGAGYSERVGESIEALLREAVPTVLACDLEHGQACDRSCYRCLRHYHNQLFHTRLDRFLAADFLRLAIDGTMPADPDVDEQVALLAPLRTMLELEGIGTEVAVAAHGATVPLMARHNDASVAICVCHSLVAEQFRSGLVDQLDHPRLLLRPLNAYQLTRNLPACHLSIRRCLGLQSS